MKISFNLGFLSIIGIVFLISKLFHFVTWSWWIVLAPFIFLAFVYGLLGFFIIMALLVATISN